MTNIIDTLKTCLPRKALITDASEKAPFEVDWRHLYANKSVCIVLPETAEEVSAVLSACSQAGVGVVPQGGNTGLVGGGVPSTGAPQVILNLRRMAKIRNLDLFSDTITVEAGVTLQAVQEEAARHDRLFPLSLGAEGSAQIGGVISTNAGGTQVLSYGSIRAMVLGLEVVLADGRIWNGLRALQKDNTGFDLKQIFIGGEGTVGIVTAATLRLFPAVSSRATALAGVASADLGLKLFQILRKRAGSALTTCEFISRAAMNLAAAHIPGGRIPFEAQAYLLVEFSAHAHGRSIEQDLEDILVTAIEDGITTDSVITKSDRERAEFLRLREMIPEGELAEGGAAKHDIAVPIGRIPEILRDIETMILEKFPGFRLNIFGHIGDGNLHVNVRPPAGTTLADMSAQRAVITRAIEDLAVSHQGSFSAEHGIGQLRLSGMLAHKSPVELDLMRRIKLALDPANTLNPGKMLPPI